ncbi:MAG: PhnD/SsuA/transferrin family substrate-binding protein [bacterium]
MMVIAIAIAGLLASPMAAEEKKVYTFGIRSGVSNEFDGQTKTILNDLSVSFSKIYGIDIKIVWFNNDKDFFTAVDSGAIDFLSAYKGENIIKILKEGHYLPFVAFTHLGYEKQKMCLYVNKNREDKSLASLKNGKLLLVDWLEDYYKLRSFLDEKPEKYFNSIKILPNGVSAIYSLALNEGGVAFILDNTVAIMKLTNPGPVKQITEIACSPAFMAQPVLRSKKTPKDFSDKFQSLLMNFEKEEATKKYRSLIKMYKIKIIPVTLDQYKPLLDLYQKAENSDWNKDFESLSKYAKKTK